METRASTTTLRPRAGAPRTARLESTTATAVPIDIGVLSEEMVDDFPAGFHWCTPHDDYRFLAGDMPRALHAVALALSGDGTSDAVVASKLFDLTEELNRIGRLAVDACAFRRAGLEPGYRPERYPLFHHLWHERTEPPPADAAYWRVARPRGTVARARIGAFHVRRRLLAACVAPSRRFDGFMLNPLLQEFAAAHGRRILDLRAHQFGWRERPDLPRGLRNARDAFRETFDALLQANLDGPPGIARAALALGARAVADHLAQGWGYLDHLVRRRPLGRLGEVMICGTPKFYGRLLGYHYKTLGRQVWRFAHGGDRAFFDDPNFGLAEFPFCDRYHCHSAGEANNLRRRLAEGRTLAVAADGIAFVPCGSARHRTIREQSRPRAARAGAAKRVMYVAGAYVGERFIKPPNERCSDPQYLDWQVWLLKRLKSMGCEVVVKVHPRGVSGTKAFLEPYCDASESGFFDPTGHDVDAYIFDFAGSAYFEALLSRAGVVYCDMGLRPIDPAARADLAARCAIVPCHLDDRGRFRTDDDSLRGAIAAAADFDPDSCNFYDQYLNP